MGRQTASRPAEEPTWPSDRSPPSQTRSPHRQVRRAELGWTGLAATEILWRICRYFKGSLGRSPTACVRRAGGDGGAHHHPLTHRQLTVFWVSLPAMATRFDSGGNDPSQ
ncbi:hypothetical protein GGTG_13993 [Gaeumannomyces tritici R3-111a-1]|uniref:Uncharacterized protein n=1 Tax=Gaeumannomyces tritici (strain R3-111a-1) TaxID=644352 RepID=J3PKD9_GAET3|nr:hypothetical protein GGTG_13993 [Gaeumannomyces tritici R3-111a-1]EJT68428.1 hypothetical protein GGTG_13993 [Gaeumannomyces tritici R3-111a-1]